MSMFDDISYHIICFPCNVTVIDIPDEDDDDGKQNIEKFDWIGLDCFCLGEVSESR